MKTPQYCVGMIRVQLELALNNSMAHVHSTGLQDPALRDEDASALIITNEA